MKTYENLKSFYSELNEFEGYIQLSGDKLQILEKKQSLPSWDTLHKGHNFILEASFFNGQRSITIRQANDKYIIIDKNIKDYDHKNLNTYKVNEYLSANIIQVWEKTEDENCENLLVLKPTLQLFSGFVSKNIGEEK